MCSLLCEGKTRVCRKQAGAQASRSQALLHQVLHFKILIDELPKEFCFLGLVVLNTRVNCFWIHWCKKQLNGNEKSCIFESETCVQILIYINAENLSIKDFCSLGELIYLQNWEIGASSWGTFPPLAFSFCTWVGGTGLWDWPVALYMAWTHRIRSCSSSLAKITVSPSFTALKNALPPSKPGRRSSNRGVLQTLSPSRASPLSSHPTTIPGVPSQPCTAPGQTQSPHLHQTYLQESPAGPQVAPCTAIPKTHPAHVDSLLLSPTAPFVHVPRELHCGSPIKNGVWGDVVGGLPLDWGHQCSHCTKRARVMCLFLSLPWFSTHLPNTRIHQESRSWQPTYCVFLHLLWGYHYPGRGEDHHTQHVTPLK